jgi:cytoskeleton protein RodZ
MPEIGPTLREARMRARIDISEVEAETKIRAKYLRALENEEWDLLPGPTFVKSFLRTYADALGLDSRALVEEYKLRHEHLSEVDLQPIAPLGADRRPRRSAGRSIPRSYLAWGLVLVALAALYAVTALGGGSSHKKAASVPPATVRHTTPTITTPATTPVVTHHASGTVVRLSLSSTGSVSVCLKAAGGRTLLRNVTLTTASPKTTYRSTEFRLALGSNQVTMRIDGIVRHVPPAPNGIGYVITDAGRHTLTPDQRPTCT